MKVLKILIFLVILINKTANAGLTIDIKDSEINKTKILFLGFESKNFTVDNEAKQILQKILYNLKTTNLIDPLIQNNLSQSPASDNNLNPQFIDINQIPEFDKYTNTGIDSLVMAQINHDLIGNLEIRIRMWDLLDRKQTFGKYYSTSSANYNKTANSISDEIYKSITGETLGHFNSQIVFITETGSYRKRIKKISLIDFDGGNFRTLTDGTEMALTPIFSKRRDEIFFLRYFQGKPQIFNLNTKTLRSQKIGGFRGTTLAPAVHPKFPEKILLTAIENGNSDIHELNIGQNFAKKLTKSPAIDTTASYSPDGNSIVFISDREGSQQIYTMNLESLSQTRISHGEGSYSKPMWSPDGKLIAFSKQKGNSFFVGTMTPTGKGEKLLTSGYLVEGAKWSPSGRYLIYSKKRAPYGLESIPRIYVIDIITGHEHEIPTPKEQGATDPDWN
jgi:TolB protein